MYKQYKKTRKISKIKKSIVSALFLSGMLLLLTGCSHVTSEMKESRENGIALMESGDYEGAVAEFDSLIDQTTRVTSFEIDVLKYRGEAEFMLGDYGAAAYTYDTLAKVDKPRAEYYCLFVLRALRSRQHPQRSALRPHPCLLQSDYPQNSVFPLRSRHLSYPQQFRYSPASALHLRFPSDSDTYFSTAPA